MLGAGIHEFMSDNLSVGERVFPVTLPQDFTAPALVYRVISTDFIVTHSDAQAHPTYTGVRYSRDRVQFDCVAESYDEAEALCDELLDLAVGFSGLWGDEQIDSVIPELRLDDFDPDVELYRVIQDLIVGHRAVPISS